MSHEFSVEDLRELVNTLQSENEFLRTQVTDLQEALLKENRKKRAVKDFTNKLDKDFDRYREESESQALEQRSVMLTYQENLENALTELQKVKSTHSDISSQYFDLLDRHEELQVRFSSLNEAYEHLRAQLP